MTFQGNAGHFGFEREVLVTFGGRICVAKEAKK
jgi:hypothetical protein